MGAAEQCLTAEGSERWELLLLEIWLLSLLCCTGS